MRETEATARTQNSNRRRQMRRIPFLLYGTWFIGGFLTLAVFGLFIIGLEGGSLSTAEINALIVTYALKAGIVGLVWIGGLIAGAVALPYARQAG